ncbi:unnamed protein product [Rangifer tarandus platyrhynchus]|uniref:Uncharacterized protein n=2 Tax=Rangifer tarandus platyrhynchus TaxID=3082113 RepID=A0ACB0F4W3_RANTA|nr:unnamed protein product [Rangifer tarandus platyrhynchus]CAI9708113.1 unnamed protein product [Rangifer tarandus platyrhynchus]
MAGAARRPASFSSSPPAPKRLGAPASHARGASELQGPEVAGRGPGWARRAAADEAPRGSGSASAAAGKTPRRRRGPRRREAGADSATASAAGSSLSGSPPLPPRLPASPSPSVHAPGAAALRGKVVGLLV